jgi:hypothetical protein
VNVVERLCELIAKVCQLITDLGQVKADLEQVKEDLQAGTMTAEEGVEAMTKVLDKIKV